MGAPPPNKPILVQPVWLEKLNPTTPGAPPATEEKKIVIQALSTAIGQITQQKHLGSSRDLFKAEVQAAIVAQVQAALPPQQSILYPTLAELQVLTMTAAECFVERTIDVPRIVVQATGDASTGYHDFDLDVSDVNMQPVDEVLLVQHLNSEKHELVGVVDVIAEESRLEDYVVRDLLKLDDIDHDTHADLLYKLEHGVTYEHAVVDGLTKLSAQTFSAPAGHAPLPYGQPVANESSVPRLVFNGFTKCLYPVQKFDSDPERRFAGVLEHDESVLEWVKPAREAFPIYLRGGERYEPDFVVETRTDHWICEVKQADLVDDPEVVEKARAAVIWCKVATDHTAKMGGKPWRYMLVPDTAVAANMTIAGLAATCERRE